MTGLMRDWQREPQLKSVYQEQKQECFKVFRAIQWRLWWDFWRLMEAFCDHETIPGAASCCLVFFFFFLPQSHPVLHEWLEYLPSCLQLLLRWTFRNTASILPKILPARVSHPQNFITLSSQVTFKLALLKLPFYLIEK